MPGGLHPSIQVIATWRPNYVNPETRGSDIVTLVTVLLLLTYIIVLMRLWSRFRLAKTAGIDDILIIFNMVPLTGLTVAIYLAFKRYGFNRHVWDSPLPVLINSRKITMVLEALYLTSTATTKISILLFYRRLTAGTISGGFLYALYAAIAFVAIYYVIFMINLFIGCRPINAFWMQIDPFWTTKYECIDEASNLIAAGIISVIQDFIACGMPTILFWKLHIPLRQKIALAAIFGIGFFICICGILRIVYTVPIYYDTYDMTWHSYQGWLWFAVESHVAVMCASAPALKIFFKLTFGASPWSSLWRSSAGPRKSQASNTDPHTTASTNSSHQIKVTTLTSIISEENLRQSDNEDEQVESGGFSRDDVELGYMDPEHNHVKVVPNLEL